MNIMKTQTKTTNMETGSIPRLLAQLAIPAVVAQVINLLYNIVDRIYIGHIPGIGAAALTGVGLFTPILMLLNGLRHACWLRRCSTCRHCNGKEGQ